MCDWIVFVRWGVIVMVTVQSPAAQEKADAILSYAECAYIEFFGCKRFAIPRPVLISIPSSWQAKYCIFVTICDLQLVVTGYFQAISGYCDAVRVKECETGIDLRYNARR
jgi:hypothetical protein